MVLNQIQFDMDNTNSFSSVSVCRRRPIRVVLISEKGSIRTMWLPDSSEGRYTFQGKSDGSSIPLYFEMTNQEWFAYAGKNATFLFAETTSCGKVALQNRTLNRLLYNGSKYVLYTEVEQSGDYEFVPYQLDKNYKYIIGRHRNCDIYYDNTCVSRKHASLYCSNDKWCIADENSSNGTYVNGRKVEDTELQSGDVVYIFGLYIIIGPGFVAINNGNNRVSINTPNVRRISSSKDIAYQNYPENPHDCGLFERQPRKRYKAFQDDIQIEMPPMQMSASKIPFLLRMGSPLVMGSQALITGNIVMTLTSLVFPFLTQGLTEKDRKEYETKRTEKYHSYLQEKEREIYREKAHEEELLNINYPHLNTVIDFAITRKRLWERRKRDEDFLSIRIGTGRIPLLSERRYNPKRFELERDPLSEEMYELAERPILLENVPIMLSLKDNYVVGIPGMARNTVGLIQAMIMQLVLTHSYDEVKLVVMVEPEVADSFAFARYLPHVWDDNQSMRFFVTSRSDALQISEYLSSEFDAALSDKDNLAWMRKHPAYVIIALSKTLFDCIEILKEVMFQEEYRGISIITAFDGIPKECSKVIDLSGSPKVIDMQKLDAIDQEFQLERCDSLAMAHESMKKVMRIKLAVDSQTFSLPDTLTFLEMFKAGRVEFLNPLKRWTENNPVKSLAAPIGIGTDGRLFTLDLHEKFQGPHGLVAGMTGSGKSEFLITYILSMAVSYSPDEVSFILIDYKGGGLADAFENKEHGIRLPHLAGTITNLDGAAINRSLVSIKSELMRRQRVFKEVKVQTGEGTLDIYDYQKLYRSKKVSEPMPHLFIISDEFAELKQQQPEFMDELISAARIGRSLGVHLILATQKPSGVVNDQIWSNTKFRVCLRVQDRSDSAEMIKRPEAAELKHTGRFYLQVGYNEYFAMGQSAWCGAYYIPQDEAPEEKDNSVLFIDNVGQPQLSLRPESTVSHSELRQIVVVVRYLSDLARREGIQARPLWIDPLPDRLDLSVLLQMDDGHRPSDVSAMMGLIDDPENQNQFPLYLNFLDFHNMLLGGRAASGKSTFLRTLLYSLMTVCSPEKLNYYIIDLSNGALSCFSDAPHCGAYLTEEDGAEIIRLLKLIHDIIERRKRLFAEAEVTSYETYCEFKPIPLILVLIDNFSNLGDIPSCGELVASFHNFLREGSNFGVRFVLTCNHANEVSSLMKLELDYRIALQAKDRYEYGDILNIYCKTSPPDITGRGMCLIDGRPLSYQTAMMDCDMSERGRLTTLRERVAKFSEIYAEKSVTERLPRVNAEQSFEEFCTLFALGRIPLGYQRSDMKPIAIPLHQLKNMSLFFGNPRMIRPAFRNMLLSARKNHMDTIIMRRESDSIFDETDEKGVLHEFVGQFTLLDSNEESLICLSERILSEIKARNVLRDQFSVENEIPLTAKGRSKRAKKYIRDHSVPILVIIERFVDFVALCERNEECLGQFVAYFEMIGYNIYFATGLYPDDENSISGHMLGKSFTKDNLPLLFGGRYDKCPMPILPYEITKFNQMEQMFNRFLVKYRETWYAMQMPCGNLKESVDDPDEAPIF